MIYARPAPHMDMRDMTDEEIDRFLANRPRRGFLRAWAMAAAIAALFALAIGLEAMGGV